MVKPFKNIEEKLQADNHLTINEFYEQYPDMSGTVIFLNKCRKIPLQETLHLLSAKMTTDDDKKNQVAAV